MPEISPDLADKVLAAETRNVIKDVGEGGKLPTAHRKKLEGLAMTPELATQHRALSLLEKFCAGTDLTQAQWEEVRTSHPGFAAAPQPPSVTANVAPPAEGFHLAAEPPKLTSADQQRYAKLYGKGWRTIYRWVDEGKKHADPCPLHDPAAMPDWWARNMKWRVPPEVEQAAAAARAAAPPPPQAEAPQPDASAPPPPTAPGTPPPTGPKFNLADFDPEEGDRLRELKQIQVAKFQQLKTAMEQGSDTTLLESKYLKLCETIDKIETRAVERLKRQKIYILRAEVDADLAANAEMLRQMQASMERRVLERCPSLNAEHRAEVASAIRTARASEEKTLSRLDVLTTEELQFELAS